MRINRIFIEAPLHAQQLISLEEKASHHLKTVLRLKVGAELILFNGDGNQYPAVIDSIEKKTVTVRTQQSETINNESSLKIHLGIAISKGDRMDWIMQKATELGVISITPLISERTEVKLKGDRLEKKLQHWRQVIISACEQSGRNRLPELHTLQTCSSWAESVAADKKFVLHHRASAQLNATENVASVALFIGPEGGLSDSEIIQAESNQFDALRLGPRVLRTETAPLAAIAVLQHVWGDL